MSKFSEVLHVSHKYEYLLGLLIFKAFFLHLFLGIAFPTCLSVNNCVGHYSPLSDDTLTLKEGDMVKIDMGCFIDEFPALVAHTLIVGATDVSSI